MQEPATTYEVNGTAICTKRMTAGMGVRQLAEAIGITPSYLRKLERGVRTRMGPEYYARLRTVLDADHAELLRTSHPTSERK